MWPIGLVPEKHSDKFRTILHLSFPKSGVTSINHFISKEDYSLHYIAIDKPSRESCTWVKGHIWHIESAFRLIPLSPSDYELFGMYWQGSYYYDKVLPFGLRSAPFF